MSLSVRLFGNRNRAQELVGEAKRQLALLKKLMGFQGLGQLTFPAKRLFDGSTIMVKSIFGIDIVEIVGAGVIIGREVAEVVGRLLIFLITSGDSYVVWRVSKGGATIIPYEFNISAYAFNTKFLPGFIGYEGLYQGSSTIKSNRRLREHYYTIETMRTDLSYFYPGASNCYPQYGRIVRSTGLPGGNKDVLVGLRNSFVRGVFDRFTFYFGAPIGDGGIGGYVCSSRNRSYVDEDEGLIKDLELKKTATFTGRIEYESIDENGGWVDRLGSLVTFVEEYDVYAVLSPTKVMGEVKEPGTWLDLTYGCGWSDYKTCTLKSAGMWGSPNCIIGGQPAWFVNYLGSDGGSNRYLFKTGDVVIEDKLGIIVHQKGWRTGSKCQDGGSECDFVPPGHSAAQLVCWSAMRESWIQNDGYVRPLDYDSVGADSFVFLYIVYLDIDSYLLYENWGGARPDCLSAPVGDYGYGTLPACASFPAGLSYDSANLYEYRLAYKIGAGESLVKVDICSYITGDSGGPMTSVGKRTSKVSCRATDKYILYTYIISSYSGPVDEDHVNDEDDTEWTFESRILGIVDIRTGLRTEHEVDDNLLGDLYKDTFDKTAASAVGVHGLER
jgi:hypothetical protein